MKRLGLGRRASAGPADVTVNGKDVLDFSNRSCRYPFQYEGKTWVSSAQAFVASSAQSEEYVQKLVKAKKSSEIDTLLKLAPTMACRKDWEEVKVQKMYEINVTKFAQHKKLNQLLASSAGDIKCSAGDPFWDNWNSIILMRIRKELLKDTTSDEYEEYVAEMTLYYKAARTKRIAAEEAERSSVEVKESPRTDPRKFRKPLNKSLMSVQRGVTKDYSSPSMGRRQLGGAAALGVTDSPSMRSRGLRGSGGESSGLSSRAGGAGAALRDFDFSKLAGDDEDGDLL